MRQINVGFLALSLSLVFLTFGEMGCVSSSSGLSRVGGKFSLSKQTSSFNVPLFNEQTQAMGVALDVKSAITTVYDFNEDEYPDLFFVHFYTNERHAYLNLKGTGFREVAVNGLDMPALSRVEFIHGLFGDQKLGAVMIYSGQLPGFWGDHIEDGRVDLYQVEVTDNSLEFTKKSTLSDLRGTITDVQFLDYNEDGIMDLAFSRFYVHHPINSEEEAYSLELYKGSSNGFTRVTQQVGLALDQNIPVSSPRAATPVYELSACDINGDGKLDLLAPGYGRRWNKLYIQVNGKFEDQASQLGFQGDPNGNKNWDTNGNSFGSICADADNDGKIDVFQGEITHLWAGDTSDLSSILWNQFPLPFIRQTDFPRPKTFQNQGDLNAAWGDVDLDGIQDLLVANTDYPPETHLLLWRQILPRVFEDITASITTKEDLTNMMGVVLVDWDLDGDLDIVSSRSPMRAAVDFKPFARLFKNQLQEDLVVKRNWMSINLHGDSKRVAYLPMGAKIHVHLPNGVTLTRFVTTGFGRLAETPGSVHFGLGDLPAGTKKLKVSVEWNSVIKTEYMLEVNEHHLVLL